MAAGEAALVVFARAPLPGQVKTRLCRGDDAAALLSPEAAAALHLAFVADVCRAGADSGLLRRRLYVAGDPASLEETAARWGFQTRCQGGGDLGARMHRAITAELAGARAVLLIGADSPTLPAPYLRDGAAALLGGEADLLLGPAADGGYWLVGASRPCPELLAPLPWGTGQVLIETLGRLAALQAAGARVRLLPFHYDVDTTADLRLLMAELRLRPEAAPASRELLRRLGLLG